MKATSNISYVDFQKKKNVTEQAIYNSWYDKWLDIKRACDPSKTIVHEAITFIATLEFLFTKNPDEIIFNKDLLQKKCKQGPRQRCRFLVQLADLYEITPHTVYDYKGKKYHYVYSAKRTKNSLEILQNPKEFYKKSAIKLVVNDDKNGLETSQKCLHTKSNLSASYIDNRNPIEEIPHSYANGGISKKEKIYKKEKSENETQATFAPCSLTQLEQVALTKTEEKHQLVTNCSQLTSQEEKSIELERKTRSEENTGMFAMSDLMAKVLNQPQKTEEMPEMKLEELPKLTEKEERAILLSRTLWQTFGEERSGEIQDDYKFVEQDQQKVCIQTKEMRLNDIEKAKIRKAIQSVYGDDVTIAMQVLAPASKEPMPSNENVQLPTSKANSLIFKSKLLTYNMQQMFNYPVDGVVKVIEAHGKIIVDTVAFLIERMTAPGAIDDLEQAVVETGLTLELHTRRVNHEYKNFQKDAIVLTPEKILKDREWLENKRKSLQEANNGI
jgi:hypothetical protein